MLQHRCIQWQSAKWHKSVTKSQILFDSKDTRYFWQPTPETDGEQSSAKGYRGRSEALFHGE